MKLPRDISSKDLIKKLSKLGYTVTRQTGSHIRLTTFEKGIHHITIPAHNPITIGTLNNIMRDITQHFNLTKDELLEKLF